MVAYNVILLKLSVGITVLVAVVVVAAVCYCYLTLAGRIHPCGHQSQPPGELAKAGGSREEPHRSGTGEGALGMGGTQWLHHPGLSGLESL